MAPTIAANRARDTRKEHALHRPKLLKALADAELSTCSVPELCAYLYGDANVAQRLADGPEVFMPSTHRAEAWLAALPVKPKSGGTRTPRELAEAPPLVRQLDDALARGLVVLRTLGRVAPSTVALRCRLRVGASTPLLTLVLGVYGFVRRWRTPSSTLASRKALETLPRSNWSD